MTDKDTAEAEKNMEAAYALVHGAIEQAERQGISSEALASALVDAVAQMLVLGLGQEGASEVLYEVIDAIEEGQFDADEESEEPEA